jgi:F1F0 ATPase subunit 2
LVGLALDASIMSIDPILMLLSLLAGALVGGVHLSSLRWVTRQWLRNDGPSKGLLLLIYGVRMALLVALGVLAAKHGAQTLLSAALGLLLARALGLMRERRLAQMSGLQT